MKIYERYLEVLETFSDYVTISEWADKYILTYPNSVIELGNSEKERKRNLLEMSILNLKILVILLDIKSILLLKWL